MVHNSLIFYAFAAYIAAVFFYLLHLPLRKDRLRMIALGCILAGFALQTAALAWRWALAGFLPVTNLFSTLFFFSWALAASFVYFELRYRLHAAGLFVMLLNIVLLGFCLPRDMSIPQLIPSLDTPLFTLHIVFSFLGYALFAMAFSLGALYLVQKRLGHNLLPDMTELRKLNEEAIFLGFCFFTLCMVAGGIWAYIAWGYYFSWNIKSLWSFLVWLFYAGMCHAKFARRWQGPVYAWLSIAGFGLVLFTYLGIGLLLESNHPLE